MFEIENYIREKQYQELALGISLSIKRLYEISMLVQKEYQIPVVNLNKDLNKILIKNQEVNLSKEISNFILSKVKSIKSDLILIEQIDIIFDPCIEIDPLKILMQAGKLRNLIVLWPGEYKNRTLTYGSIEYGYSQIWKNPDLLILKIE